MNDEEKEMMKIGGIEYKIKEDGTVISNGIEYDNVVDFIYCDVFQLCSCGYPEKAARYVFGAMLILDIQFDNSTEFRNKCNEFFKTEYAEYFMWYYLSNRGFTDHGICIPGWLTEKGKQVIYLVEKYLLEEWMNNNE